jgi:hypothetical protein
MCSYIYTAAQRHRAAVSLLKHSVCSINKICSTVVQLQRNAAIQRTCTYSGSVKKLKYEC